MFRTKLKYMENSGKSFSEMAGYSTLAENDEFFGYSQVVDLSAQHDDDDEEEEVNEDDNPPLEDDVVHSPVTTQTGGKPK